MYSIHTQNIFQVLKLLVVFICFYGYLEGLGLGMTP